MNISKEEWTPVTGFENKYKVSNFGNVFSLFYNRNMYQNTTRGYKIVVFKVAGKRICKKVHRLVLEGFSNNCNKKLQVNHIDGNKTNNHLDNLEWCTASENMEHAFRIGLQSTKGEKSRSNKLKYKDVLCIRGSDLKVKELCKIFDVTRSNIYKIKAGLRWK